MLVVRPAVSRFGVGAVVFESRVTVSEQFCFGFRFGPGVSTIRWLSGLRDQVELGFIIASALPLGAVKHQEWSPACWTPLQVHAVLARTYCCQAQPEPQVPGAVKHNPQP